MAAANDPRTPNAYPIEGYDPATLSLADRPAGINPRWWIWCLAGKPDAFVCWISTMIRSAMDAPDGGVAPTRCAVSGTRPVVMDHDALTAWMLARVIAEAPAIALAA